MSLWTKIKGLFDFGTGKNLPTVTSKTPMPKVKPPLTEGSMLHGEKKIAIKGPLRSPPNRLGSSRRLSLILPKTTNPRIKRKV